MASGLLLLTVLAGLSTFFFKESSGEVLEASRSEVQGAAYTVSGAGAGRYDGGKRTILNVRYTYKVDDQTLTNSQVAFWLIDKPKEIYWVGKKVSVFYFSLYPKIAVLKTGPDKWLLVLILAVFIGWLLLRSFLKKL